MDWKVIVIIVIVVILIGYFIWSSQSQQSQSNISQSQQSQQSSNILRLYDANNNLISTVTPGNTWKGTGVVSVMKVIGAGPLNEYTITSLNNNVSSIFKGSSTGNLTGTFDNVIAVSLSSN
jgi:hypothetical protein